MTEPDAMIEDEPKPFLDHLDEMRSRLLRSLVAFLVVLGIVLALPSPDRSLSILVFRWLAESLLPAGTRLIFLDALEPAWIILKVALALTMVLVSPYLLYQGFAFAAPAFARKSRKVLGLVVVAGAGLFSLGMAFAYLLILPASLRILLALGAAAGGVPQLTFDSFYGFVLTVLLVFGVPFELPLVLAFLIRLGIVDLFQLRSSRRFVYLGIVVLSAVITPDPTPFSQVALSIALVFLFEAGLLVCAVIQRSESPEVPEGRYPDAAEHRVQ